MPKYVDGFVIPLPKNKVAAYLRMAKFGEKLWLEHGALEYRECVAEDLRNAWGTPFSKQLKLKAGETVVFSWIVFKSRAHRDRVNAKVMKDPRMSTFDPAAMPFDGRRMLYAGFTTLVDSVAKAK